MTEFIYPGATHTRFEHSLGVMEVATRSFDILATKHGDLLESRFSEVEALCAGDSSVSMPRARQALRLAALLHDVGHTSFSHAAERILFNGGDHEAFTRQILLTDDLLGNLVDSRYWDGCAKLVAQVLAGGRELAPQLLVLHDIVSGQMDADRTDYLLRDSLHCGVDYGRFDYRRLVESLELYEDDDVGLLEIALSRDGIHVLEALILARYQMSTQVYYHRLRRIYDKYLEEYFKALQTIEETPVSPSEMLALNDTVVLARLFTHAEQSDTEPGRWAKRIAERKHHRVVLDKDTANHSDIKRLGPVLRKLRKKYPDVDFMFDTCPVNIHKLAVPDDVDSEGKVVMHLIGPEGAELGDVCEHSQVLRRIPRKFQSARIYADIDGDTGTRKDVTDYAAALWRN